MAQGIFSPRNRQKSSEDRMKELEERAKLNRGSFTALAEDTKSNIPFMLPGQRMRPDFDMNQPRLQRVAFPESEPIPEEEPLPELPTDFLNQQQLPENLTSNDFLDYFTQQFFGPDLSQGIASTPDGGVIYQDGSIHYSDGTVRYGGTGDSGAYPIASMPDGSVKYSDGSVRSFGQSGMSGLQQGLFGQELPITQAYGNVNPGMGYAKNVHGGVDLRTRNLSGEQRNFRLPVNAQVVEVNRAESGSPYGNSVLLQLPTGEMLRFSHLSQLGNFNQGDTLAAGQEFGSPGSTGNSTAEHLDLEYYDASGRRANPAQFQGFTKDQQPQQQGQVLGATQEQIQSQPQQAQPQPQQQQQQQFTPPEEFTQPKPDRPMNMDFTKIQPNPQKNIGVSAANAIDVVNPTGRFDLGITENMRGNPEAGRLKQIGSVENLGFGPELGSSERAKSQGTNVGRQFIGDALDTIVQKAKQFGVDVGERGITEKIAGGLSRFSVPQANASEPMQSIPTPGQGIDQLKSGGQVLGAQSSRPSMADISSPKVVGDVSGGDMSRMSNSSLPMDSAQMQSRMQGYDARDPFFRQGLNQKFASSIDPEKAQSGALSIDLFKDNFFSDRGNVSQAFEGTSLQQPAAEKYMDSVRQNFLSKYSDPSQYDQGDVQRILSSIPAASLNYTPSLPEPKRVEYTGNFSGENQNASPSPSGSSGGQAITSGPNQNASPSPKSYPAVFSGSNRNASQYKPPMSVPAPMSRPQSQPNQQPKQSIFSKVSNAISRLFRR